MFRFLLVVLLGAAGCAHRPPMGVQAIASPCHRVVPDPGPAVTWIAPDAARDRERNGDWCRTVGPVLAQPRRAAEAPAADAGRLAIVSWNVHVGGGDVEGFVDRLRRGEFTGGVPVGSFVLLLQEAYREGRGVPAAVPDEAPVPHAIVERPPDGMRRDIRTVAKRAGLYLFYAPSMRNGRRPVPEDRGTAILSTMPLTDLYVIELPFERQRRVALAATVAGETPAGVPWRLRVVDVQVDTSLALTRGGPLAARKRQAEALVEALTVAAPARATPTIAGGDFNTWLGPKEPAVAVMRRAFPDTPPLRPEVRQVLAASTWRGPLGARAALDYLFVRGSFPSLATYRLPGRFGSDHYPLLTLVELDGGP